MRTIYYRFVTRLETGHTCTLRSGTMSDESSGALHCTSDAGTARLVILPSVDPGGLGRGNVGSVQGGKNMPLSCRFFFAVGRDCKCTHNNKRSNRITYIQSHNERQISPSICASPSIMRSRYNQQHECVSVCVCDAMAAPSQMIL